MNEQKTTDALDPFARFHKIYDNLPLEERKRVIVVINNEPMSWEIARVELNNKTKIGDQILKKLIELLII